MRRAARARRNGHGLRANVIRIAKAAPTAHGIRGFVGCLNNASVLFAMWLGRAMYARRLASFPADAQALSGTGLRASG